MLASKGWAGDNLEPPQHYRQMFFPVITWVKKSGRDPVIFETISLNYGLQALCANY